MSDEDRKEGAWDTTDQDTPPWLQAVPEEEYDEPKSFMSRTALMMAGAATVLVVLFSSAIYFLYDPEGSGPIHVSAPDSPVRERPDSPGGMKVPHQDKEVFERGAGRDVSGKAQLTSPSERPVEKLPEMSAGESPAVKPKPEPRRRTFTATPATKPAAQPKTQASGQATTQAAVTPAVTGKEYQVQLGAYGTQKGAANAWRQLRRKHYGELKSLKSNYPAVETGDRTLYRLRVGPLAGQVEADELCLTLKSKGQPCIVIKP